jgi:hypothetical protein
MKIPLRYIPESLSQKDKTAQLRMLNQSRTQYKKDKYVVRKPLRSFKNKVSKHIRKAREMYGVDKIVPGKELAKATGCSVNALNQIVKKGQGAYYSSGSRPNQTQQSWAYARLASAVSGGNASIVDFHILEKGCDHRKPAFLHALRKTMKKRAKK